MPHVVWNPATRRDLERIYKHYARKSREAALRAVTRIEAAADSIVAFPDAGRLALAPYRESIVPFGKGAFIVLYDPSQVPLEILRIRHSREIRKYPGLSAN